MNTDHTPTTAELMAELTKAGSRIAELEATLAERDRRVWILEQAKEWPPAGDATEASDPYAHLPHGGWWVHDNDGLTFWPSECDYGSKYNFGGAYLHTYSVRWKDRPEWAKKEMRLTRAEAIAIIEAHKAKESPDRGPWWGIACERAASNNPPMQVVGYRDWVEGDYIIEADHYDTQRWGAIRKATKSDAHRPRYILAPKEASDEPTPAPAFKVGDIVKVDDINLKAEIVGFVGSLAEVRIDVAYTRHVSLDRLTFIERPTPAPSFGGPHDQEAVKWGEKRGRKIKAYAIPKRGETIIRRSASGRTPDLWGGEYTLSDQGVYECYILAKSEPVEDDIDDEFVAGIKRMPPKSSHKAKLVVAKDEPVPTPAERIIAGLETFKASLEQAIADMRKVGEQ